LQKKLDPERANCTSKFGPKTKEKSGGEEILEKKGIRGRIGGVKKETTPKGGGRRGCLVVWVPAL